MNIGQKILIYTFAVLVLLPFLSAQEIEMKPIRLAVVGATHGHISFILGKKNKGDFILSGIYEPNQELAAELSKKYDFDPKLHYINLEKMLDDVKPQAVVAFGSIYEHMAVVEACAPRKIDVMVEKPLATNVKHAKRMNELVKKYGINLLTNYETSWYPTTAKAFQLINDSNFVGQIKKVVFYTGHQGPKEIGCDKYFLSWLTDPIQNGGGALMDFGCYGANIMTWLMKGEKPISVTAFTKQYKPNIYPKVDDDATIILTYPSAECIIQASWNWPFNRKDMEVYGEKGYIFNLGNKNMKLQNTEISVENHRKVSDLETGVYLDPFSYFIDVINGEISMESYDLYSLENNITVVKILEAARESAKKGKKIYLK